MPATVRGYCATGATPTLATADATDSGSIKYGRDDAQTSTTGIPIPSSTGTSYSWLKYLLLYVTVASSTHISNRRIAWASAPSTGLTGCFQDQPVYTPNNGTQGTGAGSYPTDAGSNGATPPFFTAISTTNQQWDNSSVSTGSTGQNGDMVQTALGVDNSWVGGAGSASLPNLVLTYDEA